MIISNPSNKFTLVFNKEYYNQDLIKEMEEFNLDESYKSVFEEDQIAEFDPDVIQDKIQGFEEVIGLVNPPGLAKIVNNIRHNVTSGHEPPGTYFEYKYEDKDNIWAWANTTNPASMNRFNFLLKDNPVRKLVIYKAIKFTEL